MIFSRERFVTYLPPDGNLAKMLNLIRVKSTSNVGEFWWKFAYDN